MKREYIVHITELNLSNYRFLLYYLETLNHRIPEFPHQHSLYEIYYLLHGELNICAAGELETLHPGEMLFLAKDVTHHVYYEPNIEKDYVAIIFDLQFHGGNLGAGPDGFAECKDIQRAMKLFEGPGYYVSHRKFDGDALLSRLYRERSEKQLGWNTAVTLSAYQFVIEALRHIAPGAAADDAPAGKDNLAMMTSMYIHDHYMEEITAEDAARALNASPRHINREYKAGFSTTFMKNMNLLRMEYAKNFLCKTDMSIEEIAEKTGFSAASMLHKLFQQYEGISISQYRKLQRIKAAKRAPGQENGTADRREEQTLPEQPLQPRETNGPAL